MVCVNVNRGVFFTTRLNARSYLPFDCSINDSLITEKCYNVLIYLSWSGFSPQAKLHETPDIENSK